MKTREEIDAAVLEAITKGRRTAGSIVAGLWATLGKDFDDAGTSDYRAVARSLQRLREAGRIKYGIVDGYARGWSIT